jgi:endo-1,4-beta-xylanase
MISYVKKWIAAGVPIDGIGAQTHLMTGEAKNVPASLALLCAAAPQCAITEMDIVGAAPADYVTVIKACVDIPNCVGVTVWGVRDPDSWRAASSPLLFNAAYATKPAYSALVATIGAMTTNFSGPLVTTVALISKSSATTDSTYPTAASVAPKHTASVAPVALTTSVRSISSPLAAGNVTSTHA